MGNFILLVLCDSKTCCVVILKQAGVNLCGEYQASRYKCKEITRGVIDLGSVVVSVKDIEYFLLS